MTNLKTIGAILGTLTFGGIAVPAHAKEAAKPAKVAKKTCNCKKCHCKHCNKDNCGSKGCSGTKGCGGDKGCG